MLSDSLAPGAEVGATPETGPSRSITAHCNSPEGPLPDVAVCPRPGHAHLLDMRADPRRPSLIVHTNLMGSPDPLSSDALAALRCDPRFRPAVEAYAAANLARYRGLDLVERWMVGDMGRASLSGAALVLDALGRLTPAALMVSRPVVKGEVSRGRARLYLQRAVANGLIAPSDPAAPLRGDARLSTTPRFQTVMNGVLQVALKASALLVPAAASALGKLAQPPFARRLVAHVGTIIASEPGLFPLTSSVQLFQTRDGGTRLLEEIILRQAPRRERLLQNCAYSHSALSRASRCSRAHVIQLLRDAEARGYLRGDGRELAVGAQLSEDVEHYFAALFATTGAASARALTDA